jgi:cyclic peptide transporter
VELIRRYMRAHARSLVLMCLCSGASAGVSMLLLGFLNESAAAGLRGDGLPALLQGVALLIATVATHACGVMVTSRFGSGLVAGLRRDLCARFMALDFEQLMHRKHAVHIALIGDVGNITQLIQMGPTLLTNTLLSLAGLAYMAWLSPALTAVVLPFIGLTGLLFYVTQRVTRGAFDEMRSADDALSALYRTLVEGKKELSLSPARAGHFSRAQLEPAIERARTVQYNTAWRWGFSEAWGEALGYAWVLAAILAGRYVFGLPSELILQFVITGLFISGPLGSLFHLGSVFATTAGSLRHLHSLGMEFAHPSIDAAAPVATTLSDWQTLRLEQVAYEYPDAAAAGFSFGPVNFSLTRGETVFVTGGNGGGKSTLLLLLTGLLKPHAGRLLASGRPVQPCESRNWRSLFTAVFFDFTLFHHPIEPNGKPANAADVTQWLHRVQLQAKVELRDGMFSTIELSQGQRKRLALLQACLDDRDVMVFDEFTADQDKEFRERFYRELLPELKSRGKTLVVVSHDDRYWHLADRVVSLDHGQIVQRVATTDQGQVAAT